MARGKESQYVKKITGREVKLFKQLARTGLTDRAQAKIFCYLNSDRLQKLEKSGYLKTSAHGVAGQNNLIIQLGKEGKSYCRNELNINSFATAQSNHLEHDLKLSLTYYSLPEKIQETWEHEKEILNDIYDKNTFLERGKLKTCIDARVTINGVKTAIEVVGHSYRGEDIALKENIALNLAGCESIEFIK